MPKMVVHRLPFPRIADGAAIVEAGPLGPIGADHAAVLHEGHAADGAGIVVGDTPQGVGGETVVVGVAHGKETKHETCQGQG